jgi:hypothetical protein
LLQETPAAKQLSMGLVSYDINGYEARAEECVRLANQTKDEMIQRELLLLRQTYLRTAARLRELKRH